MSRSNQPEPQHFDVDRCIELHNQIVAAAISHNPDVQTTKGYFTFHLENSPHVSDHLSQIQSDISSELCRFLDEINIPASDSNISFTPELTGLSDPGEMWDIDGSHFPDTSYVHLYRSNDSSNGRGLLFDLETYSATFVEFYHDDVRPESADPRLWLSLEEILEKWLARIESGKYIPRHRDGPAQILNSRECASWWMAPHRPVDLDDTLRVWDEYLDAILARMPDSDSTDTAPIDFGPVLDEYNITSFLREFLIRARQPPKHLRFIAPGLCFPTIASLAFSLSNTRSGPQAHDPVIPVTLFPLTPTTSTLTPDQTHEGVIIGINGEAWDDTVALMLPADVAMMPGSAPKPYSSRKMNMLFQPGLCPFGFDHCARLEVLLLQWIDLVEGGTWGVGEYGVMGGREWLVERRARAREEGLVLEAPCGM